MNDDKTTPWKQLVWRPAAGRARSKASVRAAAAPATEQPLTQSQIEETAPPDVDIEEVARRVYRLMRNDLVLERERTT